MSPSCPPHRPDQTRHASAVLLFLSSWSNSYNVKTTPLRNPYGSRNDLSRMLRFPSPPMPLLVRRSVRRSCLSLLVTPVCSVLRDFFSFSHTLRSFKPFMPLLCQRSSRVSVVVPPLSRFLFSLLSGLLFTCYRCICSYPIHSFGPFPSIAALFVYTLPLHLITSPLHPLGSVLFPVSLHLSTVSCVCHSIVSDLCDLVSSLSLVDELPVS